VISYNGLFFQGVSMKSTLEKTSQLGRKVSVMVPPEKVKAVFDRVYKNIQKEANLKGFRKGKAPLPLIKSTYADRARQFAVEDLVSEGYSHALKEHALEPISQPEVSFNSLNESLEFQFTAEFEIRPEVELKKYKGLKVEREILQVEEERITEVLNNLLRSKAEVVPLIEDRPVQKDDVLEIDFAGRVGGEPLAGADATDFRLEIGSGALIPGFEDGLIGAKVGQKRILSLSFPGDYGNADIAGKPVEFEVTVKKISYKRLPEANDDFAKSVGDFADLAALKAVIRKDLEKDQSRKIADDFRTRLLKALVAENPTDVPQSMREQQRQGLLADVKGRLSNQGLSEEQIKEYEEKWAGDFNSTAEFMVQSGLLIDALATELKLEATGEEVNQKVASYAKETGLDLARLQEFYGQRSRLSQLRYQIIEEKVLSQLTEWAEIKEVKEVKEVKS
jgi:trigger factor